MIYGGMGDGNYMWVLKLISYEFTSNNITTLILTFSVIFNAELQWNLMDQ